ncbi:carboxypeptidase regulatory-like domain-containing protein [Marinicella marina]|uniref:carboxypeptidase regulatory-like domain-containing protein n=1 Tax=Marinicella marina TaxID=2996016 RepID=UPI0024BCC758|nr:carboxypeptidase regulatory-like domain-containing protein [Marinicella marina]MDJ1138800.1 carboxypeptidase regulatory-like domain-containing protein [Marinicella marina]
MDVLKEVFTKKLYVAIVLLSLINSFALFAQPQESVSCVVSVGNSNAPLYPNGEYSVINIPGDLGAVRARATCSDGSFGQSEIGFTELIQDEVIPLGPIEFGVLFPVPIAAELSAPTQELDTNESVQMSVFAIGPDGSTRDVTNRSEGTIYSISNDLIGEVSENGLVSITADFDVSSSARLVASTITEGSASSTLSFTIGPKGSLTGTVFGPDGTSPISDAIVSVQRLQPNEIESSVITNANGQFVVSDVNAGLFRVLAIDPNNGDQAFAYANIESEGQVVNVNLNLVGQGGVKVTVLDSDDQLVSGAEVTLTSLGNQFSVSTGITDLSGIFSFNQLPVADFTVSVRDPSTGLFGSTLDTVLVNDIVEKTIRLQQTGEIFGVVFDTDGQTLVGGVQVRISSREKGVISQQLTDQTGSFSFNTLPQSDGPFILDAFIGGRLRGRVPNLVFNDSSDVITQNITLNAVGVIRGRVLDLENNTYANAEVTVQSLVGENLNFSVITNEAGEFVLPAVPVGEFELTAITPDGETGRVSGEVLADNDVINLDITLASNTLVGTVFNRDGTSPVGAGITVYLADRSDGEYYSYENIADVVTTTTDSSGQFGFEITEAGDFYIQAETGLDRGRSQAVVVNLDPVNPLVVDVTLLAKGRVFGEVRDASGVLQEGVDVEIYSEGSFEARRTVQTDIDGSYSIDGVFAGNLILNAKNPVNNQSAVRSERLDAEGENVEVNFILSASGNLEGRVVDADGGVIQSRVNVKVLVDRIPFVDVDFANGSEYSITGVPVGDVVLVAEEISTGNKGVATTRIDFQDQVKNVDIRLIGQGILEIELIDELGDPVVGAEVTVSNTLPFRVSQSLISDSEGMAVFNAVNAGDFSISAFKDEGFGALRGSAVGTLLPDQTLSLQIEMEAVNVGSIRGVLYDSDGITPAGSGWVVRMLPEPFEDAYVTTTGADGTYEFPQVNAGTYNISVMSFFGEIDQCPTQDRNRAGATGVTLVDQDEEILVDLQLIGSGEVYGTITDTNENPVAGVDITLTNPDPFFGLNVTCLSRTTYDTVTDANGDYTLLDIPPGNFTILAESADETMRAEASDRVNFDGDEVELNLTLVDNAITMPFSFYDANGFLYDINGDGSIANGTRNVYGSAAPDNGAMLLEIITNGVPVPFVNGDGTIGELSTDGQEVIVDDVTPSGLVVTRKIRTPRSGYFSRYLEVLSNPTNDPINVGVRVKSHHRSDDSNPRVVDTSDGDQVLSLANQSNPDNWVVIDDQTDVDPFVASSIGASGHIFDGIGAEDKADFASYELLGQTGRLTYQWDDILIPPGETRILMHFALGQIKRDGARAAAERITDLSPEMMVEMTSDEKAAVINFDIPEISSVDPLPNLNAGRITGLVLSGSGTNTVPNADVEFVSLHPLFKRIRYTKTDESGGFVFESTLDGSANNYVIPAFGFNLSANYVLSGASTAITPGEFNNGETQTTQDLIFIGAGDVRGQVLRHYGATVPDATVHLCNVNQVEQCYSASNADNRTVTSADGSYELLANTPRDYFLAAIVSHPQLPQLGSGRPLYGQGSVTVTPTDVTIMDIVIEETGTISGVVSNDLGVEVSNAEVELLLLQNGIYRPARTTVTDTSGFYRFFDAPVGDYQIKVVDTISNSTGEALLTLNVDEDLTQNITLVKSVLLNVNVEYERGGSASEALVSFNDGSSNRSGRTDSNGLAQFLVQSGSYTLSVKHPDTNRSGNALTTITTIEINESDDVFDITVPLKPAGDVLGTIVRPDGTTLASGFPYEIAQIRGTAIPRITGNTTNTGSYRYNGLPLGDYILTAYDEEQDRFADAIFTIDNDGQELVLDLTLLDERIALPADLYDANRFVYDVQLDGSLNQGSNSFSNAASVLSINGEVFTGDTSARLQAGQRQFVITQPTTINDLVVSRKIYVPRGAYFSRYIEVFDNPTSEDIIVDIELSHTFSSGEVKDSSTEDIILSEADDWFIIDDDFDEDPMIYAQMPPVAHLVATESSQLRPTTVSIFYDNLQPNVSQSWSQITIPAGQSRSLMHVMIQQINHTGIQAATQRLSQLPPELLTDLTLFDIESIINFEIPIDGLSPLEPLPPLTGAVSGIVYEGNLTTDVPLTRVTIQSQHPLFSRVWGMKANDICGGGGTLVSSLHSSTIDGSFELQGQLTETDSIAIPAGVDVKLSAQIAQGCYEQYAGHPFTNVPSRVLNIEAPIQQDVIFDTGVFTGNAVGSIDYSISSGRVYLSIDNTEFPINQYTTINSDGSYIYPGVLPGTYDLLFDANHPDEYLEADELRGSKKAVEITVGQVLFSDINIQPTGSIRGSVVDFDGAAREDAELVLNGLSEDQTYDQCDVGCVMETLPQNTGKRPVSRRVITDSLGRYYFNTVPTGDYELVITDPVSNGLTTYSVSVTEDQITTQNVTLTAVGSATVTVLDVSGNPLIDSVVYVDTVAPGGSFVAGRTEFDGTFTVPNIPLGNYELRITDPRTPANSYFDRFITDEITSPMQNNQHAIQLRTRSEVLLTVIDSDNSGMPVSLADVVITDASGTRNAGQTDALGQLIITDVPLGQFTILVTATVNGIEKQESTNGIVIEANNDEQLIVNLDLESTVIALPQQIRDANNNQYLISPDNNGAHAPSLFIDGVSYSGEDLAVTQLDGRQFVINSINNYSGLDITRKAFIPNNGYFARYQEVIENNNNFDVIVDINVLNRVADGSVKMTSTGDEIIQNSENERDLWYISQDNNTIRHYGFLGSDGVASEKSPDLSHNYINISTSESSLSWNDLTIPANSRIQLMHFFVRQKGQNVTNGQNSVEASVQRLIQLPPEALTGLTFSDANEVQNFDIPIDLISTLPDLPALNAQITGQVFEGDGITPVEFVSVSVRHDNLLYPNVFDDFEVDTLETGVDGRFSIQGFLSSDQFSRPIPVGNQYTITASRSGGVQTSLDVQFPLDQDFIDVQLVFNTGSITGNLLGAFNYSGDEFTGVTVTQGGSFVKNAEMISDFEYEIIGLEAGMYDLEAGLGNFDSRLTGSVNAVSVVVGSESNVDISFEPNGAVSGEVTSSTGVQLPNQEILITQQSSNFFRETTTDGLGQYTLGAIPIGDYTITVISSETGAETSAEVTITENQTTIQDLTIIGVGEVTITTVFASGQIAANINIYIVSDVISNNTFLGTTDVNGILIAEIPVGNYTLSARNPLTNQNVSVGGVVNSEGEVSSIEFILPASANVEFYILNENLGNSPIVNATVRLDNPEINGVSGNSLGTSDVNGLVTFTNLQQVDYQVEVEFNDQDETSFVLPITAAMDGQTITKNVTLNASNHQTQSFEYNGQSLLHQVEVTSGQTLSINSRTQAGVTGAACAIDIRVFDSNNILLADGLATPSAIISQSGDIKLIPIIDTGRYTIQSTPNTQFCTTGDQFISAAIDGDSVPVESFTTGGVVNGHVYETGGVIPLADKTINVRSLSTAPVLNNQVLTDASGFYEIVGVPLGDVEVTYVERPSVNAMSTLNNIGDVTTIDLEVNTATLFNVKVLNADLSPINQSVRLEIRAPNQGVFRPFTNSSGEYSYNYQNDGTVVFRVTSPFDSQVIATQVVEASGGDVVVNLVLDVTSAQGIVYEFDGVTPVSNSTVEVYYAHDNRYVNQTTTDNQGQYSLSNLPIGVELNIVARDPVNSVKSLVSVMTEQGSTINQNILLAGRGTVFGRVEGIGGVPGVDFEVWAQYVTDPINGNTGSLYASSNTNNDGEYEIIGVPVGQEITVYYQKILALDNLDGSDVTTLANGGITQELNFIVPGTSVRIQLSASDGLSVGDQCAIAFTGVPEQFSDDQSCDDPFYLLAIAENQDITLIIYETNTFNTIYSSNWEIITDQLIDETVVLSVITGEVTYFDNTVVPNATVSSNDGFSAAADEMGQYRLLGVRAGSFELTATDNQSGLRGQASDMMNDVAIPQVLDIQLQASGSISGVVTDPAGAPLPNARVYAENTSENFETSDRTDVNGIYELPYVALGQIELSVADTATKNVTTNNAELSFDGENIMVDMQFDETGSMSINLMSSQGPIESACVELKHTHGYAAYDDVFYQLPDFNGSGPGIHSFPSVAPGEVLIRGIDGSCFNNGEIALKKAEVISSDVVDENVELGNAKRLSTALNNGGTGYQVSIDGIGQITPVNNESAGNYDNRPLYRPLKLSVNGRLLKEQRAAFNEIDNQQVIVGPTTTDFISFERQIYSGINGDFTRLADKVTNIGNTPVTVDVNLSGAYGNLEVIFDGNDIETSSANTLLNVNPQTNGNTHAIHAYDGNDNSDPAVTGYVFSGNSPMIPVNTDFMNARGSFSWSWIQTIQPGDTAIFVSYVVYSDPDDISTVNGIITELLNGTKSDMFDGMSGSDQMDVVNFQVP